MNKNLLAFFLAAMTVTLPLSLFNYIGVVTGKPLVVHVNISGGGDATAVVTAINGLHRADVEIHTMKPAGLRFGGAIGAAIFEGLALMLGSAIVGALYKFYCGKLGIPPIL